MFIVKVQTDKEEREFNAKSFYQVVMGEGKLILKWEKDDGEEERITYARIRAIIEKKI